jgi:medium-chain acyl-[acyl-carrier-protein] hydrolase
MSATPPVEPWIAYHPPRTGVRLRLFCFHYAGAGASVFRGWPDAFPPEIGIYPVQLPGRERRFREPPFTDMESLIAALTPALANYFDLPFAFFGHSMGALISFELARQLRRVGGPAPSHLFVSGRRAPQLPSPMPPLHDLPQNELMERLRELEGIPSEFAEHEELMDCLLPIIRADFTLCETYRYAKEEPLDCPLTVFGGADDAHVNPTELAAWAQHTRRPYKLLVLPGNHFFLHEQRQQLINAVVKDLRQLICFAA